MSNDKPSKAIVNAAFQKELFRTKATDYAAIGKRT